MTSRHVLALSIILAAAVLAACVPAPTRAPPDDGPAAASRSAAALTAEYASLAAAGGRVYAIEPQESALRIHVFRAGKAAKLGHNHVLTAPRFAGYYYLPPAGAAAGRFALLFRLDQLDLDDPDVRAGMGPAYASELSPDAVRSTRAHMLAAFDGEAFPFVYVRSVAITGEPPLFAAKVAVEMHGRTREFWLPLSVDGLPGRLSVSGSLVLRQSDFGVTPYSVLGGLLAVADEVVVEFTLVGR